MSIKSKIRRSIKILSTTTLLSFIVTTVYSIKTQSDIDYVGYGKARMTWAEYEQSNAIVAHNITNGIIFIVAGVLLMYILSDPLKRVLKALLKLSLYIVLLPIVGQNKAIIGAKKIVNK